MSKENIPEKINPSRLAEAGAVLHGVVSIKDMPRLGTSLFNDDGEVVVDIRFGVDEEKVRYLQGHFETELKLQCQRCMEPFTCVIMGDFLSGVVKTEEEAGELAERYDPVFEEEDGMITIREVIEDELIISLPVVPMHDPKDCTVDLSRIMSEVNKGSGGDDNPFKVIEILRTKNRNKE